MGLFDFFKSNNEEIFHYIEILLTLANIDKYLNEEKIKGVAIIAFDLGLTQKQLNKLHHRNEDELIMPTNYKLARNMIYDMMYIMMRNKSIGKDEYLFCKRIVKKLDYDMAVIDEQINLYINLFRDKNRLNANEVEKLRDQHSKLNFDN